jgi:hypothetical protein
MYSEKLDMAIIHDKFVEYLKAIHPYVEIKVDIPVGQHPQFVIDSIMMSPSEFYITHEFLYNDYILYGKFDYNHLIRDLYNNLSGRNKRLLSCDWSWISFRRWFTCNLLSKPTICLTNIVSIAGLTTSNGNINDGIVP